MQRNIEEYEKRFKTSPIGNWSEASGTFSNIMDSVWEFNADHTGRVTEYMPGGIRGRRLFEWKEVADFTIACRVTEVLEDYHGETKDLGEEAKDWVTIEYHFRKVSNDCADVIGMVLCPQLDEEKDSYDWDSWHPLMYLGK